jgi:hypothetical protein
VLLFSSYFVDCPPRYVPKSQRFPVVKYLKRLCVHFVTWLEGAQ